MIETFAFSPINLNKHKLGFKVKFILLIFIVTMLLLFVLFVKLSLKYDSCVQSASASSLVSSNISQTKHTFFNLVVPDESDWSPLHHASANGNLSLVKSLIESEPEIDILKQTANGETALDLAISHHHSDVCRYLVNVRLDRYGWTMLHKAAASGNMSRVKFLIANNANLFAQTWPNGDTALDLATQNGQSKVSKLLRIEMIHKAIEEDNITFIKKIIKNPDFNWNNLTDEHGWTPLHFAAQQGKLQIIKLLISALVDAHNSDGQTALEVADANDKLDVVKFFEKLKS